ALGVGVGVGADADFELQLLAGAPHRAEPGVLVRVVGVRVDRRDRDLQAVQHAQAHAADVVVREDDRAHARGSREGGRTSAGRASSSVCSTSRRGANIGSVVLPGFVPVVLPDGMPAVPPAAGGGSVTSPAGSRSTHAGRSRTDMKMRPRYSPRIPKTT